MVLGKLLILLSSPAYAENVINPKFIQQGSGNFVNTLVDLSFGWFRTLKGEQKDAYDQSIVQALEMAENGQKVSWYVNDASGYAMPVITYPSGSGYCRRLYIQAVAYGVEKNMYATACFENFSDNWRWISSKY